MDDREANQIFDRLVKILEAHELEWVSNQVIGQIQFGKTIEIEIKTLKSSEQKAQRKMFEDDISSKYSPGGPKDTFPTREEYSPTEKLLLLIDAIDQAIVATSEMEMHLFKNLGEERSLARIEFSSEEDESILEIDIDSSTQRNDKSQELLVSLEKLRGMINYD